MTASPPIRRAGRPSLGQPFRLFCLPPAGAGPSIFYPWLDAAASDIEVCPIALPGREDRLRDPLPASIAELAEALAPALAAALDRPYAIVGYSMGALIGYELARRWQSQHRRGPDLFVALAARSPTLPLNREMPLHRLGPVEFRQALVDIGGTPRELLDNRDAMSIFEPILRNDLRISETYRPTTIDLLDCPLQAIVSRDDALLTEQDAAAWAACTRRGFHLQVLDGPHILPRSAFMAVLQTITERWVR
ncbi:MAG: thioesterase [Burkholderiales bacterium]|nr:thioesterase [Burkholderiales bacterium]